MIAFGHYREAEASILGECDRDAWDWRTTHCSSLGNLGDDVVMLPLPKNFVVLRTCTWGSRAGQKAADVNSAPTNSQKASVYSSSRVDSRLEQLTPARVQEEDLDLGDALARRKGLVAAFQARERGR
jgi:hypothetical protein